jgi:hypothetical protein
MPLATALGELRGSIAQANAIVSAAYKIDAGGQFFFTATEQSVLVQSAFLRVFIAWETFLESTFVSYLVGSPSITGKQLTRYAAPKDRAHALGMVIGGMRFVDWTTPESVRKLASLFFDGGDPYETVLAQITSDLYDLKTIRNAAAHLASTSNAQLDALATRRLSTPTVGITVAKFIMTADPKSATGQSMLQTYEATLDTAAHLIADA